MSRLRGQHTCPLYIAFAVGPHISILRAPKAAAISPFKSSPNLDCFHNDTRKDANQRNKMRTYQLFKTIDNYECEDYLHQVTNTRHRIALTKLRISNHKLAIETGRYSRPFKKPAERICPICKIEMEDEYHFLNICPAYQEKRCSLLDYLEKEYRIKISRMSPNKIFMFLINPPSGNVKIQKNDSKTYIQ